MFKWFNKLKNKKGFTLIELIVVLAVLGIIALIAIPRFLQVRAQSEYDADLGTAAGIAKAAELYYVQDSSAVTGPDITALTGGNYLGAFTGWQSSSSSTCTILIDPDAGTVTVTGPSSDFKGYAISYPAP